MKIFHLFANHKFTGPADPALILAAGQAAAGVDVRFLCSTVPEQNNALEKIASNRGLQTIQGLRLSKHIRLSSLRSDVKKLRKLIEEEKPDFLHSHLDGDHLVAVLAGTPAGPALIRSRYDLSPPRGIRAIWLARHTDLWIVPTEQAAEKLSSSGKSSRDRIRVIPPLLDLERFQQALPSIKTAETDGSSGNEKIVVGVVARMQRHRKFPDLIKAFVSAARIDQRLHLEILGRGTYQDEVARFPARDSGMSERIHFPGYIDPADYPTRLASFDMVIFLVPGSDGTCRAAREALACGVPVISSQRGLLPSLIPETGGLLLADEKPETLTQAILSLAENSSLRQRLAQGAKKYAESVSDVNLHIDGLMADLKPFLATS